MNTAPWASVPILSGFMYPGNEKGWPSSGRPDIVSICAHHFRGTTGNMKPGSSNSLPANESSHQTNIDVLVYYNASKTCLDWWRVIIWANYSNRELVWLPDDGSLTIETRQRSSSVFVFSVEKSRAEVCQQHLRHVISCCCACISWLVNRSSHPMESTGTVANEIYKHVFPWIRTNHTKKCLRNTTRNFWISSLRLLSRCDGHVACMGHRNSNTPEKNGEPARPRRRYEDDIKTDLTVWPERSRSRPESSGGLSWTLGNLLSSLITNFKYFQTVDNVQCHPKFLAFNLYYYFDIVVSVYVTLCPPDSGCVHPCCQHFHHHLSLYQHSISPSSHWSKELSRASIPGSLCVTTGNCFQCPEPLDVLSVPC